MISQKCPKCSSKRIRRGYRQTPLWSKILFRYHLLCDNCNWEFKGFAVPGTVKTTNRNKKRLTIVKNETPSAELLFVEKEAVQENSDDQAVKETVRKKSVS